MPQHLHAQGKFSGCWGLLACRALCSLGNQRPLHLVWISFACTHLSLSMARCHTYYLMTTRMTHQSKCILSWCQPCCSMPDSRHLTSQARASSAFISFDESRGSGGPKKLCMSDLAGDLGEKSGYGHAWCYPEFVFELCWSARLKGPSDSTFSA